jgi:hypothetical protein
MKRSGRTDFLFKPTLCTYCRPAWTKKWAYILKNVHNMYASKLRLFNSNSITAVLRGKHTPKIYISFSTFQMQLPRSEPSILRASEDGSLKIFGQSELRHNSKDGLFTVVKRLWRSSDWHKILKNRPQLHYLQITCWLFFVRQLWVYFYRFSDPVNFSSDMSTWSGSIVSNFDVGRSESRKYCDRFCFNAFCFRRLKVGVSKRVLLFTCISC